MGEKIKYINASIIGEEIGVKKPDINEFLAACGLLEARVDHRGDREWRLTDAGRKWGREKRVGQRSDGSDIVQIKWLPELAGELAAVAAKLTRRVLVTEDEFAVIVKARHDIEI